MIGPDMVECPECRGQCEFDGPIMCGTSSGCSDGMCGGCVESIPCEHCEGEGEVAAACEDCGGELVNGECWQYKLDDEKDAI